MDHQALETRRAQRAKRAEDLAKQAEEVKNKGNEKFRKGDYFGAVSDYVDAINRFGPNAVLLSNLAVGYFKLDFYEEALWAATAALEYDPRMLKARFRRAQTRKKLFLYKAAVQDLEIILSHFPDNEEAKKELTTIRNILGYDQGLDIEDVEVKHPPFNADAWETYMDSDTENSRHIGNGTPCRFYNHNGCARDSECKYSHAADDKSLRDDLGKNVCLEYIFKKCPFGPDKCIYSHDARALPPSGWWHDPAKVEAAKKLYGSDALRFDDYEGLHATLIHNPLASGLTARQRRDTLLEENAFRYQNVVADIGMATPPASTPQSAFVLLLSFDYADAFTSIHTHLLDALKRKTKIVEVREYPDPVQQALHYLAMPNLTAVFLTDPAIIERKFSSVLKELVKYVKNGGSVVMAGQFSGHVSPDKFDKFIKNSWGLDWKYGSYHRTTFTTNPANEIVKRNTSLVLSYSMKTLHIGNIQPEMAIYVPADNARIQSMVFSPVLIKDTSESPAVCARVGRGLLSFLGDVNGEISSTNTILAMLGLLDEPNVPLAPQQSAVQSPSAGPSNPQNGQSSNSKKNKKKGKTVASTGANGVNNPNTELSAQDGADGSATTSEKPSEKFLLILALSNAGMFERVHAGQMAALKEKITVKVAEAPAQAIIYLSSPNLCGVYIVDEGLTKNSTGAAHVLGKVVEYVKSGGLALIGGLFSSMTPPLDITRTFSQFGLPWRKASYVRAEAELVPDHEAAIDNPSLPDAFSMKAVHLAGFHPEDMFYLQNPLVGDEWEASVLRTRLGKGHLGYIGDVNAEEKTTPIVLAMFGLLTPKKDIQPDSKKFFIVLTRFSTENQDRFLGDFLKDARQKAEVIIGLSNARVIDLLPSSDLLGILVTDASIVQPKNAYLLSKIVAYSKQGGKVVFGSIFSQECTVTTFRPFFRDNWGLDWDYRRGPQSTTVAKSWKNSLAKKFDDSKLPNSLEINGIYVDGIEPSMAVYIPEKRPQLWRPAEKIFQSSIIYADVDKGHLGFIGDASLDGKMRAIFYAMVGLL